MRVVGALSWKFLHLSHEPTFCSIAPTVSLFCPFCSTFLIVWLKLCLKILLDKRIEIHDVNYKLPCNFEETFQVNGNMLPWYFTLNDIRQVCVRFMACNGEYWPPPANLPPTVLKFFNLPQSSNFLLPPSTGNGCFCIFHAWVLPTSTCSYFWSSYNWLNVVINDF